ncbi:hypothetical protein DSC45_34870 [Streptomyces sp. YIM 130001]|uniref:hypothetical protein n=1 Tax=Streptomyces sp. YIM 130001 TaxID=2259644 RepID=UPI000E65C2B4|nr:hypothetical protein [Streptomyces sp. YIM 130001]RII06936.1 hypothetical protein DSC45_34870 [Streptomyces sp. YIM 130001]
MTSTTDAAGHPDVSEISDLTEGLLAASRAAELQQHLDGCELCADVHASLAEIRGLLGEIPSTPRMPADVAQRIDAALAAEALLDATAPDASEPATASVPVPVADRTTESTDEDRPSVGVSRETPTPVSRETPTGPLPDVPGSTRPSGHPRGATGPGRPGGRRRRRGVASLTLGALATVAAIGLGALMLPDSGQSSDSAADAPQKDSARAFSDGALSDQVAALVARSGTPEPERATPKGSVEAEGDGSSRGTSPNKPLRQPEHEVPACVQRGIDRDSPALGIQRGSYEGTGAFLVVLPHASDPSLVSAYVVDASCIDEASSTKGEVLLTQSYPRS